MLATMCRTRRTPGTCSSGTHLAISRERVRSHDSVQLVHAAGCDEDHFLRKKSALCADSTGNKGADPGRFASFRRTSCMCCSSWTGPWGRSCGEVGCALTSHIFFFCSHFFWLFSLASSWVDHQAVSSAGRKSIYPLGSRNVAHLYQNDVPHPPANCARCEALCGPPCW